jgi:hypothetical protein
MTEPAEPPPTMIVSYTGVSLFCFFLATLDRRVGKANGARECAPDGVPTIQSRIGIKMVGTAQGRLCPPYGFCAQYFGGDRSIECP